VDVEHPVAGKTRLPALPIKFSNTPAKIQGPSPLLGEHTKEVLRQILGLDEKTIKDLEAEKVI
jgi:CoA:oxalate CoA-transferase